MLSSQACHNLSLLIYTPNQITRRMGEASHRDRETERCTERERDRAKERETEHKHIKRVGYKQKSKFYVIFIFIGKEGKHRPLETVKPVTHERY